LQIDHVYTWVNPDDHALIKLRAEYAKTHVTDEAEYVAGPARTRDNGELRLSLRTAEKFMPFIRNTYIVGNGDAPDWILELGPRVIYVKQSDIIPARYYPFFHSDAIESFIYKIPGLSNRYIYSNDDFFFARPHQPSDLFDDQGRALVSLAHWPMAIGNQSIYRASEENTLRALGKQMQLPAFFSTLPSIFRDKNLRAHRRSLIEWLSLVNRNLPRVNVIGHVSQPYLKSEWEAFHDTFRDELETLFTNRFRSDQSISVNMMYMYFLNSIGKARLHFTDSDRLLNRYHSKNKRDRLRQDILTPGSHIRRFCLNDTPVPAEDGWQDYVNRLVLDLIAKPPE